MKVYATYNIKGGVGKTSTAVNLAYLAAASGRRTLLWDLDPQGAASYLLRVRPRVKGGGKALVRGKRSLDQAVKVTEFDGLDLVPADFTYRNLDLDLDATKRRTDRLRRLVVFSGDGRNFAEPLEELARAGTQVIVVAFSEVAGYAIGSDLLLPVRAAAATRTLARTASDIPRYPMAAENAAPTTKATLRAARRSHPSAGRASRSSRTATANQPRVRNCRRR